MSTDTTLSGNDVAAPTRATVDDASSTAASRTTKGKKNSPSSVDAASTDAASTDAPADNIPPLSTTGRAGGFRDGLVYAIAVLSSSADVATATETLKAIAVDTGTLLRDLEAVDRSIHERLRSVGAQLVLPT